MSMSFSADISFTSIGTLLSERLSSGSY